MGALAWLTAKTNTGGWEDRKLRVRVTAFAVIGFMLFGYDQGLMSGLVAGQQFNWEFPATHENSTVQGAVTASYELGCFFGALFALFFGDKLGRRTVILIGAMIFILGVVISITPFRPYWPLGQFVVGRVITGVGNGMNTATIPVWQSEMSRPENRGRLILLEGSAIAVGTLIAYWLDFGFSYIDNSAQWRFPVGFQMVFAFILIYGVLNLPESPRWLVASGRKQEAHYVMGKLNGVPEDDDSVCAEITVISDAVNRHTSPVGFRELCSGGKTQHFQRMVIGASTQFFQQFTGCNAAIYYSTLLFYQTIFDYSNYRLSLILGGVFATVYTLATIPSFWLVDSLGRRKLFLIGAAGQGVAFTISFACLINKNTETAKGAAVGIFIFIIFFAFTILPLPWIYPPEINPLRTRTVSSAISTCTNWITNFAVVLFVPRFIEKSGWGCYLFFAAMNFSFIPIIYFFYPETAGRSLEEIDIIFAKAHIEKRQPWRVAATMPHLSLQEIEEEGLKLGLYDNAFEKEDLEHKEKASVSSTDKGNEIHETTTQQD
ncbi:STL1 [[Candida] subhashii]|uniref:STL1 n=1 Tax=[Candida] subhashii TaxID=561895 RepID=A0A8J5UU17_9ASCO|nr:STL1 [[Candida] subhashii]KAG7660349.1 STL1 [[Candida] subhashii]